MDDVLFDIAQGESGNIGIIILNRPSVLNSLNNTIINQMYEKLVAWAASPKIKAVIIKGSGEKAFCAGGDLRLTYELYQKKDANIISFFKDEYRLNSFIHYFPKPYIAFLNGITMGGGVGVSMHGSHRIATERLVFAMPETGIGLFPDVGGTFFLPRLRNHIGYYLGLTGNRINADDCCALEITQHKMEVDAFEALIEKLAATKFKKNAYESVTEIIQQFNVPSRQSTLLQDAPLIEEYFSAPTIELLIDKLQNSSQPLLHHVYETLQKKSPTSLKVTFKALQKGSKLTFNECMEQEYRLVSHFIRNHDFFEGIRAIIIDKDQQPKWQPSTLSEVTNEMVDNYFAPVKEAL